MVKFYGGPFDGGEIVLPEAHDKTPTGTIRVMPPAELEGNGFAVPVTEANLEIFGLTELNAYDVSPEDLHLTKRYAVYCYSKKKKDAGYYFVSSVSREEYEEIPETGKPVYIERLSDKK